MEVSIVHFPETKVAGISHKGAPSQEHETARKLVAWKLEHRLLDQARYRTYGLHYTDPRTTNPADHRVDFCLSHEGAVEPNAHGVVAMTVFSFAEVGLLARLKVKGTERAAKVQALFEALQAILAADPRVRDLHGED
jgi:DNA gyrase inhibitor GyrI